MSVATGPNIVTSGLLMEYDMSNTGRSWIGAPTTNYITDPTEVMPRGEFGQYRDLAPTFNTYGLVPYSLSMDMKTNKPGSVLVYMQNGSSTKYAFVSSSVNATTEYQRFYFNNITPSISTPSDVAAILATYTGYGSGVTPTVKNIQLELGTFATPFVAGTRTNTQSLLDVSSNNIITTNSLTYASDNTFSFNGTNNYINSNWAGVNTSGGAYNTVSMWMYWTGAANGFPMEFSSGYRLWMPSGNLGFNNGNGDCYGIDFNSYANQWVNVVAVFYNGVYTNTNKIYINGVSQSLTQRVGGATSGTASASGTVGGYASSPTSYPFPGKITYYNVYNRELTATEVFNNFSALRGRYGI